MDTNELKDKYFIGVPKSRNFGDNIQLIAMCCFVANAFRKKKPISTFEAIKLCIAGVAIKDEDIQNLAIICDALSEQCIEFPDFGISPKEMPGRIKALILDLMPF